MVSVLLAEKKTDTLKGMEHATFVMSQLLTVLAALLSIMSQTHSYASAAKTTSMQPWAVHPVLTRAQQIIQVGVIKMVFAAANVAQEPT